MGFTTGGIYKLDGEITVEKICKVCNKAVEEFNADCICKDCQQPS